MPEPKLVRTLTRKVRTGSPPWLVGLLRSVISAWGSATAPWRLEPAFIVVGAQRSGTTTLYRLLSEHPAVVRPTVSKGTGYFEVNYRRGRRWYRGHFPLRITARLRGGRHAVTFESSGYCLFHPLSAQRMARDLPNVKVVVMVREPVERAYSAHKHELARGFETEPFETALELEEDRTRGEVERMIADPDYESYSHRHHAYLARSRYSEQIARFVDALGADRVHIVDADAFFGDPQASFARLVDFLGLPPWQPGAVEQWNARPGSPLPDELRRRLEDYFEPYDRELAAQMGRTPSWRQG